MKNVLVYLAAVIVVLLSLLAYTHRQPEASSAPAALASTTVESIIQLKGNSIHVTVVSTDADRERGLGGRSGLAPDEGMLFVFETDGDYAFWMKDMLFSIDIVWIDSSGKIVYIAPSVAPDTYPQAFDPHMNAKYVLELPAGYVSMHKVHIGDVADL